MSKALISPQWGSNMQTKKLEAKFTTSSIGDHFTLRFSNTVDLKKKLIKEVFTIHDNNEVSVRLTPESALKLAQFIDESLEDYDFEKRRPKKRKG